MTKNVEPPKYDDLFKTTLEVLTTLSGSGSIEELDERMIAAVGASQELHQRCWRSHDLIADQTTLIQAV